MIEGSRRGRPTGLLRSLIAWQPRVLDAFVLPGADIALAQGLDLEGAGVRLTATPRHANCLLIVAELPPELRRAAAVVYAQMPRPRVLVALGVDELSPLPAPDVVADPVQEGLEYAVAEARRRLREEAWSPDAQPFEPQVLLPRRRRPRDRPAKEAGRAHEVEPAHSAAKQAGDHDSTSHGEADHGQKSGGRTGVEQAGADHGQMSHGGSDMGFMSMVRLTQHLPRSADGLPMERVQAPFGPFFPGLPSGLGLTLSLDGDTVARVDLSKGTTSRGIEVSLAGDLSQLPERMSQVDPLAPQAYHRLGMLSLQSLRDGSEANWVMRVELERVASHLNWLAGFGRLLGLDRLARQAGQWQLRLRGNDDPDSVAALEPSLGRFIASVLRTPMLRWRLRGIGSVAAEDLQGVSGPVARASGLELDARLTDPSYRQLGFRTVVRHEGDAMARLEVRLEEIRGSLALVRMMATHQAARAHPETEAALQPRSSPAVPAAGTTVVETPRGQATLILPVDGDQSRQVRLQTPSAALSQLIEVMAVDLELADALVAIASLDISPWEIEP